MNLRRRVISRHRMAMLSVSPERIWLSWLNVRSIDLGRAVERLEVISKLTGDSKIGTAFKKIANIDKAFKDLHSYEPKFRRFLGMRTWTPELLKAAKELATERKIIRTLRIPIPSVDEDVSEGVYRYFNKVTKGVNSDAYEKPIYKLFDYAEGRASHEVAEKGLQKLEGLKYELEEQELHKATTVFPEVEGHLRGDTSFRGFRAWVGRLRSHIDNPTMLLALLDDWEDRIPSTFIDFGDQILPDLNFDLFDSSKQGSLFWVAEIEAGDLLDVLDSVEKVKI